MATVDSGGRRGTGIFATGPHPPFSPPEAPCRSARGRLRGPCGGAAGAVVGQLRGGAGGAGLLRGVSTSSAPVWRRRSIFRCRDHAGAPGRLHRCYPRSEAHFGALDPLSDVCHGLGPQLLVEQWPYVRVTASVTRSAKDSGGHAPCSGSRGRGIVAVGAANQHDERRAAAAQLQRDREGGANRGRTDQRSPDGSRGFRSSGRWGAWNAFEGRGWRRRQRGERPAERAGFVSGQRPEPGRGLPPGVVQGLSQYPD